MTTTNAPLPPLRPPARHPARPRGVPLSAVDAAWWGMERPTNRMVITAVLLFAEPFPRAELLRLVEERLLRHRRFRCRVEPSRTRGGGFRRPRWVDVEVDPADHVVVERWPAPGDERALERRVATLLAEPLDEQRPLWRIHLFEQAVEGGGRSAIVVRVHHCVADGVALVGVLLSLTDEHEAIEVPLVGQDEDAPPASLGAAARRKATRALTLARLALLRPEPKGPFKRPLSVEKCAAWTDPVPLDRVKEAADAAHAHITDVLLANVAGALADALPDDAGPGVLRARALVPLFLRPTRGRPDEGNHFGLVFVPLPLRERSSFARVRAVQKELEKAKSGTDARVAFAVLAAFGRVSRSLASLGIAFFSAKATAMITSVPGPMTTVHLLGHPVDDIIAFGPASGSIAVTTGLFSYRGRVRVAFAVDGHLCADARRLVDGWLAAQARLIGAA